MEELMSDGNLTTIQPDGDEDQAFNCTNFLNDTDLPFILGTPTNQAIYSSLATAHIGLSILPSLVLAILASYLIFQLTKHPSKIVLQYICMFCILGPCSYTLLMDVSLILDIPVLGRCDRKWEGSIYWLAHSQFETSLVWLFGFNAIILYATILRTTTQFDRKLVHLSILCIVGVAVLESTLWVMLTENYVVAQCKIRGSFCITVFGGHPLMIVFIEWTRVLMGVVPVVVSVPTCLGLYWHKVKSSLITINQSLHQSLINLTVALIIGTFLCNLPTMILHFATYRGSYRTFVSLLTTYALQLNYTLYPLLILTMHRDLRRSLWNYCSSLCIMLKIKKITRVAAEGIEMQTIT